MSDPSSRMLRLLSLLQTHRYWTGDELSDRLDVSARTLRRDVDRLRELGYPVDAARGVSGGYQLRGGSSMPPLLLDDDDAVAIAVGLRTAASSSIAGIEDAAVAALAKLDQVLPPRLRSRVQALGAAIVRSPFRGPAEGVVDAGALATIAQACRDRERLRFGYRRRDGEAGDRTVEPHRLVSHSERWYLVAWDVGREDWRTFRVDRVEEPRVSPTRFPPRSLPGNVDAAEWVSRSIRSMPTRFEAEVVVHAPAADLPPDVAWVRTEVEDRGDGTCVLRTRGDDLGWLAIHLCLLEREFEVVGPPELGERVAAIAGRMVRGTASVVGS